MSCAHRQPWVADSAIRLCEASVWLVESDLYACEGLPDCFTLALNDLEESISGAGAKAFASGAAKKEIRRYLLACEKCSEIAWYISPFPSRKKLAEMFHVSEQTLSKFLRSDSEEDIHRIGGKKLWGGMWSLLWSMTQLDRNRVDEGREEFEKWLEQSLELVLETHAKNLASGRCPQCEAQRSRQSAPMMVAAAGGYDGQANETVH